MKLLFDLFPVILFFVTFKFGGVFAATATAIAATFVQVAWVKYRHGKVDTMLWVSLGIITVFGGATLLLHDETFIKWKPTVLYLAFAGVLAAGKLVWRRDLLASVMKELRLPPAIWTRLTWAWILFFGAMAFANWYIAFHFPTATWVNFKVWGGIGLFVAFAIAQGLFLARHVIEPSQ